MSSLKFAWKPRIGAFGKDGDNLLVGEGPGVVVGWVVYNSTKAKGSVGEDWAMRTALPGFEIKKTLFADREEAKSALERFVTKWFQATTGRK